MASLASANGSHHFVESARPRTWRLTICALYSPESRDSLLLPHGVFASASARNSFPHRSIMGILRQLEPIPPKPHSFQAEVLFIPSVKRARCTRCEITHV